MKLYFLVFYFLATRANNLSSFDIAEEAEEQLYVLKTTVQTQILLAHDAMSSELRNFLSQSAQQNSGGLTYIQTHYAYINEQIIALESIGNSAGVDVTPCIASPKEKIESITKEYLSNLALCIGQVNKQGGQIFSDGLYANDIYFNKVNSLEFQLQQCGGELICISTVSTDIQKHMISIPQDIQVEVDKITGFLEVLTPSVDNCVNNHVSEYSSEVESILSEMAVCINNMLNY